MEETRIERDSMGTVAVPAERWWGAQTQRSLENFRIGGERMPPALIRALALQKKAAALTNVALGALDRRLGEAIEAACQSGDRRHARRRISVGRVANRIGHADQHEHERGLGQPRQRGIGRQARRAAPDPSQRPRQSQPVLERQLPDRDAHRGGERDPPPPAAGAAASGGGARRQGARIRRHRQDRPHPSPGRDAGAAQRRVRRLSPPDRARHRARRGDAAAALRGGAGRHRRRHRSQRAQGISPSASRSSSRG